MTITMKNAPARTANTRFADGFDSGKLFNRLCATVLTLFALIWLVPFVWAIITSLRNDGAITKNPVSIFGGGWSLHAYSTSWNNYPLGWWYANSFIVSSLSVVFTVLFGSMAGFSLAHLRFPGKKVAMAVILAGLMLPSEALILPQFMEYRSFGLLGTYWALILPAVAGPVSVIVFQSFFKGIPSALIEAARLDGASWWRVYWTVCLPVTRPAISAVSILTFITAWNQFLWPLLVLSQTKSQTIPVGLSTLIDPNGTHYSEVMASSVLGFIPLIAVFLVFQRQIVQGVASTGIK